jgi:hypothetical protein
MAEQTQQLKDLHEGMVRLRGDMATMATSNNLNAAIHSIESQIQRLKDLLFSQFGQGNGKEPLIHFGSFNHQMGMGETSYPDGSTSGEGIIKAKTVRMDFPRFDGEDPEKWSYCAEQFFKFYNTPANHHISISSFHVDDKGFRDCLKVTNSAAF